MAILKHSLTQILQIVFPSSDILNTGWCPITVLADDDAGKIPCRMPSS